ncbi:MAG TPA: MBL fold metallo-hydrolase, partial [bacterium]|nr:MBL fold metallo-hydrolase [bacterium]
MQHHGPLRHAPLGCVPLKWGAWLLLGLGLVQAGEGAPPALGQEATAPRGPFHNTQPTGPLGSFWRWQWERWRDGLPKPPGPGFPPPLLHPDLGAYRAIARSGTQPGGLDDPVPLIWIGHATFLLSISGVNILTDPQFSERASPLSFIGPRRVVPPALTPAQLPHIEAV